jgi:hypothetical protein
MAGACGHASYSGSAMGGVATAEAALPREWAIESAA